MYFVSNTAYTDKVAWPASFSILYKDVSLVFHYAFNFEGFFNYSKPIRNGRQDAKKPHTYAAHSIL